MSALSDLPHGVCGVAGPLTPETARMVNDQLDHDATHRLPERSRAEAAASYARTETGFLAYASAASTGMPDYPERVVWQAAGFYREALWSAGPS